jgi:preprotein translocase subunit YajC
MPLISEAFAQGAAAGDAGGGMTLMLPLILMFAVFYLLVFRPQAKRQKELKSMIEGLKKGDEVVTTGGMIGCITEISDQWLTLQVATVGDKPVAVSVQRSAVAVLLPKGSMKAI